MWEVWNIVTPNNFIVLDYDTHMVNACCSEASKNPQVSFYFLPGKKNSQHLAQSVELGHNKKRPGIGRDPDLKSKRALLPFMCIFVGKQRNSSWITRERLLNNVRPVSSFSDLSSTPYYRYCIYCNLCTSLHYISEFWGQTLQFKSFGSYKWRGITLCWKWVHVKLRFRHVSLTCNKMHLPGSGASKPNAMWRREEWSIM